MPGGAVRGWNWGKALAQSASRPLARVLAAALGLRLLALTLGATYHPDEIYQYLEQAHRLVFGYAVVPWEYHYGIRSWFLPTVLAGPMALGDALAPGTQAYLLLPRLMLVGLSLLSVLAAYRLGARISARHAMAAAWCAALWPEFVLFAGQALTDSVAVPLVLMAASLLVPPKQAVVLPRNCVLAGLLLGFALVVRFQYLPALIVLVGAQLWCDRGRRCRVEALVLVGILALGALIAFTLAALPDMARGDMPYRWLLANFQQNIGHDRARAYGVDGPWFYPVQMAAAWAIWIVPLLALAWLGARRCPALAAMALTNIVVHSLIAHKEYRFILLSTMTIALLAALGSIEVLTRGRTMRGWRRLWQTGAERAGEIRDGIAVREDGRRLAQRRLAIGWGLAALTSLFMPDQADAWADGRAGNHMMELVGADRGICGVALWDVRWARLGGYVHVHRPVPFYLPGATPDPGPTFWRTQAGYNAVIAPRAPATPLPAAYALQGCTDGGAVCLWRRAGGCDGQVARPLSINRWVREPEPLPPA